MVIFYIGLDCINNNFIMLCLCLMLKKYVLIFKKECNAIGRKNVVILLIVACCLYIIMTIFDTGQDFMHNTFIMKYICLILKKNNTPII